METPSATACGHRTSDGDWLFAEREGLWARGDSRLRTTVHDAMNQPRNQAELRDSRTLAERLLIG